MHHTGIRRHRRERSGRPETRSVDYRVLVIDDDDTIRDSIAKILTALGYRVTKAENGMMAMSLLATDSYNVVVTDLEMPLLNGYRLCTWLKKKSPDTKLIIMSSGCEAEVAEFMTTGLVDRWMFKPFGVSELSCVFNDLGLPITHFR